MNMINARVFRNFVSSALFRRTCFSASRIQAVKLLKPTAAKPINPGCLLAAIIPSAFVVKALTEKNKSGIIKEADILYDENKFDALYGILTPHRSEKEPEILWRLARALYEMGRDMKDSDRLLVLEDALALVDEALEINDSCWAAHKWRAILLDCVYQYKGARERILQSYVVRKHMERAIELNPKDSTSYYILGEWCFTLADMPWYQRQVVAVVFASLPSSTYKEALKHFEKAEEISPLFYSMNLLMLAKCLLKLNNVERAVVYLRQLKNYPVKTADDREAQREGAKLMRELRIE